MKLIYPILLVAAAIPVAEQAIENWLANDSEARWVPFTLTSGNQIRFIATVDGRPVGAILDTGVSDSAMSRRLSPRSAPRGAQTGTASAIGGPVAIGWASSPRVAFGGLDHRGGGLEFDRAGEVEAFDLEVEVGAEAGLEVHEQALGVEVLGTGDDRHGDRLVSLFCD